MTVWGSECFGIQSYDALTKREREIAVMLSNEGISNKEIGQRLHVAEGTVKIHMCNIFRKLGISKRASLVRLTYQYQKKGWLAGELRAPN